MIYVQRSKYDGTLPLENFILYNSLSLLTNYIKDFSKEDSRHIVEGISKTVVHFVEKAPEFKNTSLLKLI